MANSSVQLAADPGLQGRVAAAYGVVFVGARAVGGPLLGWMVDALGSQQALVVVGVGTTVGVRVTRHVDCLGGRGRGNDCLCAARILLNSPDIVPSSAIMTTLVRMSPRHRLVEIAGLQAAATRFTSASTSASADEPAAGTQGAKHQQGGRPTQTTKPVASRTNDTASWRPYVPTVADGIASAFDLFNLQGLKYCPRCFWPRQESQPDAITDAWNTVGTTMYIVIGHHLVTEPTDEQ